MSRTRTLRLAGGTILIPADALDWQFVRSAGPGGQHVNRTSSKAVLRFAVRNSPFLPPEIRSRLEEQQRSRLTADGDLLISSQFVYDLDEVLSQWSSRSEISKQIGEALAKHYDSRIARVLVGASTEASPVTGEPGGFEVNIGVSNTNNAQAIVDGFFEAAAVLDERSAPQEGRCAVLSPRQYYSLISSVDTNILNRELGNTQGDLNSGKGLYSIAGIRIYKSNVLAGLYGATKATVTGENNAYPGTADLSDLAGLVFHREAAGVVEAVAPSIETTSGDFHVQYQGDLIVGKLAMGAGSLRTSVAGALRAA